MYAVFKYNTVKHIFRMHQIFAEFREQNKISKLHTRENPVCPSKAW